MYLLGLMPGRRSHRGSGAEGAAAPVALMVQVRDGAGNALCKHLSRISATSETFDLLSFCQCPPLLSEDMF